MLPAASRCIVTTASRHSRMARTRSWRKSPPSSVMKKSPHSRPTSTGRSEEHTSELQSLMRISYAVFCLKKKRRAREDPDIDTDIQSHQSNQDTQQIHSTDTKKAQTRITS